METERHPLAGLHVLVADDNIDGADSLVALLQLSLQCRVDAAYDGAQALRVALERRPHVVILDIRMPRLSGIEVARQIRRTEGYAPLLVAMTGNADIAEDLANIDLHFDHAYAKPVEPDNLVQALTDHWLRAPAPSDETAFELSDLFTRTARESARLVKAGGHTLSFDYRGPSVQLATGEAALHAALHRLMSAAVELMQAGFLIFSADARPDETDPARCHVVVNVGGTGEPSAPQRVAGILQRLGLTLQPGDDPSERRASGACPHSGGKVEFASRPTEGMLLSLELELRPLAIEDTGADAHGALAWIIGEDEVPAMLLERRLQRIGWHVRRFAAYPEAAADADGGTPPRVVIFGTGAHDAPASAAQLHRRFGEQTRVMLLADPGAPGVAEAQAAGCDVRAAPLSPRELIEFTQPGGAAAPRRAAPPVVDGMGKPMVLVVDDNRVNRIVATGLVEALGYDAIAVNDGLDAIETCKRMAPAVVLMDVNMPVLGGIDATRRIRELQRLGRMAPFAIVAATADADDAIEAVCVAAGMDDFLAKPLRLAALAQTLKRVAPIRRAR